MTLRGRDIVCVGFSDWQTDILTTQQHLVIRVARENRVLFVESLGLRRPQLAGRDVRRIARRLVRGVAPPRQTDGVHVLAPLVLPFHGNPIARRANAVILPRLVGRAARRLGMRRPMLWSFVPQAEELVATLDPELVLYYCTDDHAAKKGIDAPSFRAAEDRFTRRADIVLASAPAIVERLSALNGNVHYAPSVADTDLFAQALEPGPVDPALAALPAPRIVFHGAIVATTMNLELMLGLARLRPDWSFALVGPVGPGDPRTDVSVLDSVANIHLLGHRPYGKLPDVLRGADAGIVPYRLDGAMASVFPMKVHEYLAAGRPVVATSLPALAGVADIVTADDAPSMAAALSHALEHDSPERRAERSKTAAAHSWDARVQEIFAAIAEVER